MNDFQKEFAGHLFSSGTRTESHAAPAAIHGVGQLLRRAYYKALEHSSASIRQFGLTTRQAAAIREVATRGNMSQAELGTAIGMEPANVHGLVERLKKKGLISAERDSANPRRMRLSLTADGEKLAGPLHEAKLASEEAVLRRLDPSECELLLRLLSKITQ